MRRRDRRGVADDEDGAFAFCVDTDGDEDGAVKDLAAVADFFVVGVDAKLGVRRRVGQCIC